jgi:ribonucleotide reductase alpha subunit
VLAKKVLAKNVLAKKALAKKVLEKKVLEKKVLAKKVLAKKVLAKKALAKKALEKKALEKKALAKKALAKKALAKKVLAKRNPARRRDLRGLPMDHKILVLETDRVTVARMAATQAIRLANRQRAGLEARRVLGSTAAGKLPRVAVDQKEAEGRRRPRVQRKRIWNTLKRQQTWS